MKNTQSSLEKLFAVKSGEEPQPSLSAWGVDMIKLLASTFILKPLMNHVKHGKAFALIYADSSIGVILGLLFWGFFHVNLIVKKSCSYEFYLKLFVMANLLVT